MSSIFRLMTICAFALCALLPIASANGQSLVILDCQGITRAIHEARGAQLNRVEVQVTEPGGVPSSGSEVQLTNNVTGEVYTAQSTSGSAVFDAVPVGNYSMAVSSTNLTVGSITIGSTGLGAVAAGGVLAGGVVAGGGAVAGGVVVVGEASDQLGGNSDSDQPTPTPTPGAGDTPTPQPTPNSPIPTPTPTCDCDPDAEPTPIDDFFGPESTPAAASAKVLSPYR